MLPRLDVVTRSAANMDVLPITESQFSVASSPIRLPRVVQESLWFWWCEDYNTSVGRSPSRVRLWMMRLCQRRWYLQDAR